LRIAQVESKLLQQRSDQRERAFVLQSATWGIELTGVHRLQLAASKEDILPRPLIGREPTVVKSFRVEPELWEEFCKSAKQHHDGIGSALRIAMMHHLTRYPVDRDKPDIESMDINKRVALVNAHAEEAHEEGRPLAKGLCTTCDYYL